MMNQYDEIKNLLKKSSMLFNNEKFLKEEKNSIKSKYGLLLEVDESDPTKKINPAQSVEKDIENAEKPTEDKQQSYRISGGLITLHGKDKQDLELTTDEKTAFQETMDEFMQEVSDLVDFDRLNVYENNVEWSGKIIDFDLSFYLTIGENNGIYLNGDMIKTDENFTELVTKLKSYYEKFKSKWAKILASRKKTNPED
jgi:hypothetical protein